MLALLLKYNIAEVLDVKGSFFYSTTLPKNTKLTEELIEFNYRRYSPFSHFSMISYIDGNHLYIWFIDEKKSKLKRKFITIPNTFLLFNILKKKDGIYLCETDVKQILVIKNGVLLASSFVEDFSDAILELIKTEYQLQDSFSLSKSQTEALYKESIERLSLVEIGKFIKISKNRKEIFEILLDKLTYPFISLVVVYMLVTYFQAYFMKEKQNQLQEKFLELKTKNRVLREAIHKHNQEIDAYRIFLQHEIHSRDPYAVLYKLYDVITKDDKAVLKSLEVFENSVKIKIETNEDPIKYLEKLNKVTIFENVVLENVKKFKKRKNIINYSLRLKDINEKF